MYLKRPAVGLSFCLFYLASYFTNKYVLSVLKFTYPTLFQGWQTLIGGFLLHISWKLGWVEISSSPRSEVLSWLPASALFVGIIYAGSRALSRLASSSIFNQCYFSKLLFMDLVPVNPVTLFLACYSILRCVLQ
uniref:Transmembrane protein 241 n=1 Tax=Sphenodon punctatus TaxID=8508 RepID=A0A8D0HC57_SPHPU